MANNEVLIPIPGRLHSVATEGHVAGADEIFDDTKNKTQATINAEVMEAIGTGGSVDDKISAAVGAEATTAGNAENALGNRITPLETAVGTGGSVDSRIATAKSELKGNASSACDTLGEAEALISAEASRAQAAEADRYTKSETYTKTEVNGLVDTPHQEYVTVDAYANLPATGSKDTIYRVSNYNGSTSQVDASVYSEYAWDGSQYVFLCVKSQIGEVFDISVYNNNAKYADLAAALNGGANIPQSLQKGGMSVKFVQSSDNKYVQYRLMTDEFTTTVSNWQGVDDEPTPGSDNLVKSGGVEKVLFGGKVNKTFTMNPGGGITYNDIELEANETYIISILESNVTSFIFWFFNEEEGYSNRVVINAINAPYEFTPLQDGYLRVANADGSDSMTVKFEIYTKENISSRIDKLEKDTEEEIDSINEKINSINEKINGEEISKQATLASYAGVTFNDVPVEAGKKYYVRITSSSIQSFEVWAFSDGEASTTANKAVMTELNKWYSFTPAVSDYLRVGNGLIDAVSVDVELKVVGIEKAVNEISKEIGDNLALPPIIIRKVDNDNIKVFVKNTKDGKYIVHPFVHASYSYNMSEYGGPSNLVCGDMWDVKDIEKEDGTTFMAANLNFIYMVDSSVPGFENENLHVGMGGGESGSHGLEVREWTRMLADGKEIDVPNMTGDIYCTTFRIIQKSNCYAPDSSISSVNTRNYPKIVNGQPVVTAQHFIDATYTVNNNIKWRNRLLIRRDGVKFVQCHGGMLATATPYFSDVIINDNKVSQNHFEVVSGESSVTAIGDSDLLRGIDKKADEAIMYGNGFVARQRLIQDDGTRFEKTHISSQVYGDQGGGQVIFINFKCYMQPVLTTDFGANAETFNDGDIISVTNEREIELHD